MSTSSARLARLLALVPYLLARPGTPVSVVAAEFGVTEKQIRDDLELLFVCGLPGYGPGELIDVSFSGDTVTVRNAETIGRPLRLALDEAVALIVALRALADVPGAADDAVVRALAKLERAAGDAAGSARRVSMVYAAPATVLAAARDALDRRRRVHLTYYVPARDETTERDVDPMRVLVVDQTPYLEGWCHRVGDVRLFRLDRVLGIRVLDEAGDPPAEAQPRDMDAGLFQPRPDDTVVTLDLGPGARWVAEYYPIESATEEGDRLRVTLRAGDVTWVRRLVLRLGGDATVIAPDALREAVAAEAGAALAAYR